MSFCRPDENAMDFSRYDNFFFLLLRIACYKNIAGLDFHNRDFPVFGKDEVPGGAFTSSSKPAGPFHDPIFVCFLGPSLAFSLTFCILGGLMSHYRAYPF